MRYTPVSSVLFSKNRLRLKQLLEEKSLAIIPSAEKMPRNGDQYFPFRQQSDFFYLTGIDYDNCYVLLFPQCPNPAFREVLFIEAWDPVKATWEGHMLTKEEATQLSGISQVFTTDQLEAVVHECMTYAKSVVLNLNEYIKFKPDNQSLQQRFAANLRKKYPLHTFGRLAPMMEALRTVKSDEEIAVIQQAIQITGLAFERLLKTTKPGLYEYDAEAEISYVFTKNKASGHAYQPIIGSGKNSCVLHYHTNNRQMQEGDLVLFDFGAEYGNYCADLSRTIPVNGKFSDRQKQCYEAVLRVFRAAVPLYQVGNTIDSINEAVWKMMENEMIQLGLFSADDVQKQPSTAPLFRKYLMHGIAHHIGLDVHDPGSKYAPLKAGMILTCEPGLYIRDEGIGIRLENDILITDNGPVDLMAHIPVEADEIEKLMRSQ